MASGRSGADGDVLCGAELPDGRPPYDPGAHGPDLTGLPALYKLLPFLELLRRAGIGSVGTLK